MLKNITLSAEKNLIERARKRAKIRNTTLNAEFRRWLAQYTEYPQTTADLANIMEKISYAQAGKRFTRDDMNER